MANNHHPIVPAFYGLLQFPARNHPPLASRLS